MVAVVVSNECDWRGGLLCVTVRDPFRSRVVDFASIWIHNISTYSIPECEHLAEPKVLDPDLVGWRKKTSALLFFVENVASPHPYAAERITL